MSVPDPAKIKVPITRHPYVQLARSYRIAHRITVPQMAGALGVNPRSLDHWETRGASPSKENLVKFAKFFNLPAEKSGKEAA